MFSRIQTGAPGGMIPVMLAVLLLTSGLAPLYGGDTAHEPGVCRAHHAAILAAAALPTIPPPQPSPLSRDAAIPHASLKPSDGRRPLSGQSPKPTPSFEDATRRFLAITCHLIASGDDDPDAAANPQAV